MPGHVAIRAELGNSLNPPEEASAIIARAQQKLFSFSPLLTPQRKLEIIFHYHLL